jgi:hypothetical protein
MFGAMKEQRSRDQNESVERINVSAGRLFGAWHVVELAVRSVLFRGQQDANATSGRCLNIIVSRGFYLDF